MAARNPQHTCALLIGSGICYSDSKGTVKKGGIRRTLNKDGEPVPNGIWAEGDLDSIERLLNSKGVRGDDVSRFNYHERDEDTNIWAKGRLEVLRKIGEFFQREDRTRFVLYYTGHGFIKDGSWAFPVTRLADSPERSADDPHQHHEGSGSEEDLTATKIEVQVVIEDDANKGQHGAEGSDRVHRPTPESISEDNSEGEDTVKEKPAAENADNSEGEDTVKEKRSNSEYSVLGKNLPPAVQENEFVDFEDVMQLWEKGRKEGRYLVIILDCCHAGKWVEYIDGDKYRGRRDISIQAACYADKICKVAKDQRSSVFTNDFVNAQELSFSKVFLRSVLDHLFILNIVSLVGSQKVSPVSSRYAPFGGIKFFDSYDEMYLRF